MPFDGEFEVDGRPCIESCPVGGCCSPVSTAILFPWEVPYFREGGFLVEEHVMPKGTIYDMTCRLDQCEERIKPLWCKLCPVFPRKALGAPTPLQGYVYDWECPLERNEPFVERAVAVWRELMLLHGHKTVLDYVELVFTYRRPTWKEKVR